MFYELKFPAQEISLHCPGPTTIDCTAATPVIWDGTAFNEQCPNSNRILLQTNANVGEISSCGVFTVNVTGVNRDIDSITGDVLFTEIDSSLSFNAQPSLNGSIITCRIGSNLNVNVQLLIPGETVTITLACNLYLVYVSIIIDITSVSVSQDSLTAVTVTLTVSDTPCAEMYFVEVTQDGSSDSPIIRSSSSPSVIVDGLDLCRNRYSVVGFVQFPSGLIGERLSSQPLDVNVSGVYYMYTNMTLM